MDSLKYVIALIICSLAVQNLHSQELEFESVNFDFGTIAEDGGVVTTNFKFKNNGKSPAVIVSANSSCGCTVPEYSRQPILPGESSTIKVDFDPMGRPGQFNKTIQLLTAPDGNRVVLTIGGDVTPRKLTLEEQYPFEMGSGLRFASNYYPLSYIEQGQRVETQVKYINTSKRSVKVGVKPQTQSGFLDVAIPAVIEAEQEGSFAISYDMKKNAGFYGSLSDKFAIEVNGREGKYPIMVNALSIDAFSADDKERAPICNIGVRVVRLGEVKHNRISDKGKLMIENLGVSDLIIRAVQAGDGVVCSVKSGDRVAPGEKLDVEIWTESRGKKYGNFSEYLTLTVNDPDMPQQRVRVVGTVIE